MMMKLSTTILCLLALQFAFAQKKASIFVMDYVKVKENRFEETLYYYENNWKVLRERALEKGYITSYQILNAKSIHQAEFDIILITEYADSSAFNASEDRFQELIKEKGELKLLNDLKPNEFKQNLFVTAAKTLYADKRKYKKRN